MGARCLPGRRILAQGAWAEGKFLGLGACQGGKLWRKAPAFKFWGLGACQTAKLRCKAPAGHCAGQDAMTTSFTAVIPSSSK